MGGADGSLNDLYSLAQDGPLSLLVGILAGATHTDERGHSVAIAEYAMANEFGTRRIPPRPAFRATADARMEEWEALLADLLGSGMDARAALEQVGAQIAEDIRESIDQWRVPPNAPETIARKRSKTDNPLVDSGDMLHAVNYHVSGQGEG